MEAGRGFENLIVFQQRTHRAGVKSLALFGSVGRDQFSDESDLDLLVEFDREVGLFEFMRLKMYLEECTHRRVDLVTRYALHPAMKDQILAEAVQVR